MKKTFKFLVVGAVVAVLGLSTSNFASAKGAAGFSVAVVDIPKIVESSPQVSALKIEQKNKITDLVKFVENAKADVAKQETAAKKKSVEDAYNKELNVKKAAIDKEYAEKLIEIDKSIKEIIKLKATKYDLVLVKSTVLEGGVDITEEIVKSLK